MTGHRFQAIDPRPYMRMGTKPPTTCAYCGKFGGDPSHNTKQPAIPTYWSEALQRRVTIPESES